MVIVNKQITLTGASVIKEDDKEKQVAYMNATITADGKINIAHAVQEPALFETHRTTILEDFSSFDEYAYSVISEDKSETA